MDLYICEKPSQAKDLAAVMGVNGSGNGCITSGGITITWAYGHLLEQYMPQDYDPDLKKWNIESLPIIPEQWKYHVKKSGAKQYKVIQALVEKASTVFISTDYDREGESIAREILTRVRYRGPIKRVCLSALDPSSIKKALRDVKEGNETLPLYFEAMSRQRADWLVGMNFTRLYTSIASKFGVREVFNIGRVLTPTVILVANRDREIADFTPSPYHLLDINVSVQNGQFKARWVPGDNHVDENGRCTNKSYAELASSAVQGQQGIITRAETKKSYESPPLPFDQTSIQQFANNKWGYTADQVITATQALYETHKATTYPRTDCRYLPEETHDEAAIKFKALADSDESIAGIIAGATPTLKSRAFDNKKVEPPHDAIVPTGMAVDVSKMSGIEYNIYDAIRRRYVAQFYNNAEFYKTNILVECNNNQFIAKGKTPIKPGWQVLYAGELETDENTGSDNTSQEDLEQDRLPQVSQGEIARISGSEITDKMTRPPSHFTEATLLGAMKNISRFVHEPQFKQILKETSGLGTSATRAGIIKGAVERGYICRKAKKLRATDKAYTLDSVLPDIIKSPGMTAMWEQELSAIGRGELSMSDFNSKIVGWITSSVELILDHFKEVSPESAEAFSAVKEKEFDCPNCQASGLVRKKGKYGFYWPCNSCNTNFKDKAGKPVDPRAELAKNPKCPKCSSSTRLVKPKNKAIDSFFSCINHPECSGTLSKKKSTSRKKRP